MFLFWLAVLTATLYTLIALDVLIGNRSIRSLRGLPAAPPANPPMVSIITAARNEDRNIREALSSLLSLNYPNVELIVVDDRSGDGTGVILEQMAANSP